MDLNREEIVKYLREIHSRPGGTAGVLNLFRAEEVRAAADLAMVSEIVSDSQMRLDLARHGMDEARHGYLLLRRMSELGTLPSRVPAELDRLEGLHERSRARDMKQVYSERGSVGDAEMMEFMTVGTILEAEGVTKLELNAEALDNDPKSQAVMHSILRDEQRHIDYLNAWLERFEKRFSRRAVRATRERLQEVYRQLDVVYYGALRDYFQHVAMAA